MSNPLVSIIIPTYNRAHLIGETLDSIVAQTYKNWECIIVDDGSTDDTEEIVKKYIKKDNRFQYHLRPEYHKPGGNGARNYGFKLSKGEFIQWFDSDDLMDEYKLALKVEKIICKKVDFVVSKSRYIDYKNNSFFNYKFKANEISFEKFAIDYVRWVTDDLLVRREVIKSINFNENLKAGQEYNFNCKMLLKTNKMFFIDEFLVYRRYSDNSIQRKRDEDISLHQVKIFETSWINYQELKDIANSPKFNRFLILKCVLSYLSVKEGKIKLPKQFHKEIRSVYPMNFFWFYCAVFFKFFTGKYFIFYKFLKGGEVFNTYSSKKN